MLPSLRVPVRGVPWRSRILLLVFLAVAVLTGPACTTSRLAAGSATVETPGSVLPFPDPAAGANNAQLRDGGAVGIRATLSPASYGTSAGAPLLLKVDYAAASVVVADRPPLNLALVLDNSGSMAEGRKLPYTLEAARWIVENLTDRDTVSIVVFNDHATVIAAAGRVVNKPFLYHRLGEIAPSGYTNLSGGLLEGIAQIESQRADGQAKHVLVLTDGLANRGLTGVMALRNLAVQAKAKGIGVSTFGVGSEFNETLLAEMASAGGGRYVYVNTPEQIPTAFSEELHGLLQVVAQNAVIELTVTGGSIGKLYGLLLDHPVSSYRISLGDVRATESGFLLAELQPQAHGGETTLDVIVRLVFDDPQAGGRVARVAQTRPSFGPTGDYDHDPGIMILAAAMRAVEEADAAARGLDVERYRRAAALFQQLHERTREFAMKTRDQQLLNEAFVLKHFMAELAAAEQQGLLHGHREAQQRLRKESHYLRYLLTHHRPPS